MKNNLLVSEKVSLRPRDWAIHRSRLTAFLREFAPHPLIFATLSGGDLYGFPSDDGDFDLRASHVLPTRDLIVSMLNEGGMDKIPGLTLETIIDRPLPEIDFVSHDIGKLLRLALKGNGYVLEQLLSPLGVATSEWHAELKAMSRGLITRRLYFHYRGFFTNQEKLYNNIGSKKVKGLLYQYRVAMTGIHVLRSGEIDANIVRLNEIFDLSGVNELVAMKMGAEDMFLTDDAPYLAQIKSLEPVLNAAYEESRLPDVPSTETRAAVEDFLLRCRTRLGA